MFPFLKQAMLPPKPQDTAFTFYTFISTFYLELLMPV